MTPLAISVLYVCMCVFGTQLQYHTSHVKAIFNQKPGDAGWSDAARLTIRSQSINIASELKLTCLTQLIMRQWATFLQCLL